MFDDVVDIVEESNDSPLRLYYTVTKPWHHPMDERTVKKLQFGSLGPTFLPDKTSEVVYKTHST